MPNFKSAVVFGIVGSALADGPPWESRDDIPSGCIPTMKVPDGGRCLFDDQCKSGYCCPYYRSCIGYDPGYLEYADVEVDPVRLAMMWGIGGPTGTVDGVANHVLEGATDTCDRDRPDPSSKIGLCNGYTMNEQYSVNLQDEASYLPAFNLMSPECKCDQRFKDLYVENSWTGAFFEGGFRNYCDLAEWDYILSPTEASGCPEGRSIITDVSECQDAIAYLGLGDSTAYMNGQFGPSAFPGCVNNAGNNQVAFNAQNAETPFQLSSVEQFVCKKGAGSESPAGLDGSTTTMEDDGGALPTCRPVSGEMRNKIKTMGYKPVGCSL